MENSSEDDAKIEAVFDDALHISNGYSGNPMSLAQTSHAIETPASSELESDRELCISGDGLAEHEGDGLIHNIEDLDTHPRRPSILNSEQASQLIYPRSQYKGYAPPLPICKERVALQELLKETKRLKSAHSQTKASRSTVTTDDDYVEIKLSTFSVYLPDNPHHPFELRGLQHLASKSGHSYFLFDGILSVGNVYHYVQGVPFKVCSIGNYGQDVHEVGSDIWVQSDFNDKSNVYYRLGVPSSEYARYHEGFLWLADLAKHFVDYCQACERPVSVQNFRSDFSQWIQETHKESSNFRTWYQKYQSADFRRAVAHNVNFLFKESLGVDDGLRSQPIWGELLEKDAIPQQPLKESKTVVTPYIFECFKHLRFGHHLKPVDPANIVEYRRDSQTKALDLTSSSAARRPVVELPSLRRVGVLPPKLTKALASETHTAAERLIQRQRRIKAIKVGDVISVTKDGEDSKWKDEISQWKVADDCWYVLVQQVHVGRNGERSFDGIWLYKPSDTACAKMKYPFANEIFLSDNCTCSQSRIAEGEVLDIVAVVWHGHPSVTNQNLFVRQTYLENERFVTLKDEHKYCKHMNAQEHSKSTPRYPAGQTVLAPPQQKGKHALEPYELVKYVTDGSKRTVFLRRLQRRKEIDGRGRPNEVVYTDRVEKMAAAKVHRTCLVRFYTEADITDKNIPAPYSRDGTGNAFYITRRLVEHNGVATLIPIDESIPRSLIQGFDPSTPPTRNPLRGMDLYCGGGNFGRGLEEGGAVHNTHAVDINKIAIHTYAANLKSPDAAKLYFGSVDDLLREALNGNLSNSDLIPLPGDIDFISAGSPCQGFSTLNMERNNEKGLKNQSLVASVAAYVDFYRPQYGLLENVMNMAQKGRGRDEDVLSQLICAIVGMGYQLQLFVLDAWSSGSPQSRTRLFVSFAAPGLEPLEHPALSHSHPTKTTDRGLGKLANGQTFGSRLHDLTPFEFVTAHKATKDLPVIGDGRTHLCIPHPDHVMAAGITELLRLQMNAIPLYPRGMDFVRAWNGGHGVMSPEQRLLFPFNAKNGKPRTCITESSRAWKRVHPDKLFPIVTVSLSAADARQSGCFHWDQQRYMTVMETRRAQTFPDEEVLVGTSAEGWKLMGNSVARTVALSLGLSLREAWLKNVPETAPSSAPVSNAISTPEESGTTSKPSRRVAKAANVKQPNGFIPDSTETSADKGNLSEHTFRDFLDSLPLRTSTSREADGRFASSGKPVGGATPRNNGSSFVPSNTNSLSRDTKGRFSRDNSASTSHVASVVRVRDSSSVGRDANGRFSSSDSSASGFRGRQGKPPVSAENRPRDPSSLVRDGKGRFSSSIGEVFRVAIDQNPSSMSAIRSPSNAQTQARSLKRLHAMMQETKAIPPAKMPRLVGRSTATQSPHLTAGTGTVTDPQRAYNRPLNHSGLANKLRKATPENVGQRGDYFADNDEDDGKGEDSEDELQQEFSPIPPSLESPNHLNRFKARTIQTPSKGLSKSPSKPKSKVEVVINLVSDDESSTRRLVKPVPGKAVVQSTKKYDPVDNSQFMAYAQTNHFMKQSEAKTRAKKVK